MSTIIATTLSNGSVSVPTATVVNGSAKAWVNFDGTGTIAARGSFNVASLTDNGTGDYTVNFTAALTDANYSSLMLGRSPVGTVAMTIGGSSSRTASSVRFVVNYANNTSGAGTAFDVSLCDVAIFR
jgi:hypothetical protein